MICALTIRSWAGPLNCSWPFARACCSSGSGPDPSLPLDTRLARLLHTLSSLYGLQRPEGILLDMKISQSDLADWLGVSRQRINFVIQQLQADGLIHLRYSTVTIVDAAGLVVRARL